MKIQVLFFGATASAVGNRRFDVSLPPDTTSGMAMDLVQSEYPALKGHKLLFSINQSYVTGDEIIRDGDELAIFTAVSGG